MIIAQRQFLQLQKLIDRRLGRTYEEIDILFEKRVPARQFKSFEINAYEDYDKIVAEKVGAMTAVEEIEDRLKAIT